MNSGISVFEHLVDQLTIVAKSRDFQHAQDVRSVRSRRVDALVVAMAITAGDRRSTGL